jgi:predicted Rossmann fold flavoprotein
MNFDVIIIGAGAAGLMAAAWASKRGRQVLLLDHSSKIGEKIRISGGGRCNFTNIDAGPKNYLSQNPHFVKSPLASYSSADFIDLVNKHNIPFHEKTLGQLFCDGRSEAIINMLVAECASATIMLNCEVLNIAKPLDFSVTTTNGTFSCKSLIIASGGLSIPKLGATNFGYRIAKQFGLKIVEPKAALVPLTVSDEDLGFYSSLSGVAVPAIVSYKKTAFKENILFTHRGLSGPAILQISSYLEKLPAQFSINLLPDFDLKAIFAEHRSSKTLLTSFLKEYLPKRLVDNLFAGRESKRLVDYKVKDLESFASLINNFTAKVAGSEGFAKAEVTIGGVDTTELSSKTMAATAVPNLYFIGEVVDVTGWLGGYNFQWAWSSGYVAGNNA